MLITKNPDEPVVLRNRVKQKNTYSDYKEELRRDFWYSCAYCSMTEHEAAAIGFEIDHYWPKSHFDKVENKYKNLYWTCQKCNRLKGDMFSTPSKRKQGYYFIRVDVESPSKHLDLNLSNFELTQKTITGEFNIECLQLNRQYLTRLRSIRSELSVTKDCIAHGLKTLANLSLDDFPKEYRPLIYKMKDRYQKKIGKMAQSMDELILEYSISNLIDPDPEHADRLNNRRKYLNRIGAITSSSKASISTVSKTKSSKKNKKK